jgi:predicted NBD/HSP70 family sugar kinase
MSEVRKPRVTVRDVRRVNRAALLQPLLLNGPLNRLELSEVTGLSSASIANVVAELLDEGLIAEAGTEESDGGRPRGLLRVNPSFGNIAGVTVSEHEICIELFDMSMNRVSHRVFPIRITDHPVEFVINQMVSGIQAEAAGVVAPSRPLLGVGVAMPGAVEHGLDYLVHAPKIGWANVALAKLLNQALDVPIVVENDAKTLGQAEMWFGAGRGTKDAMIARIGDGVGAALFNGGFPYHGFASSAGEWGHMCIVPAGRPCRCGAHGCLEAYVGAHALIGQWAESDRRLQGVPPNEYEIWIKRLVTTEMTKPVPAKLIEQTATYLGIAAANVVNLVNPERIVVGGWAGLLLGPVVIARMREVIAEQSLAYPANHVSVELGQLGSDSDGLAAATQVVAALLAGGGRLDSPWHPQRARPGVRLS